MSDAAPAPGPSALTSLSEGAREQALARFQLLRPFLEEGVPLTQIAQQSGEPLRTLLRWVQQYRAAGLVGLARQPRSDQGRRRRLTPELEQFAEGLALQRPLLSVASIHRQVCERARAQGAKPPSYDVVHDVVRRLPAGLTTLAHEGSKAYSQRFDLVHRREAPASNAIWQADHCQLDILLVREGKPPTKPWLTVIQDDYSRAVAGYFLSFDPPCTLHTALALRQAIWRKEEARWHICGIPAVLYTDHGSDFTSKHLEQVAADLKMQLVFSLPGQPRGRGRIERFFSTMHQLLISELPGYAPGNGSGRGEPQLSLAELDSRFREFLLTVYHRRVQPETKQTPHERWEAGGFLPQMPESLEQLDLLLLTVAQPRKVHPDGIRFLGRRYLDPNLAAYVGEDVLLRYDPRDLAEVRLFYQGRFLCRAICPELAGETVSLREIIQARRGRRRELRQTLQERQRTVDTLLEVRRGVAPAVKPDPEADAAAPEPPAELPRLKRYFNE
jgi:putative transposase